MLSTKYTANEKYMYISTSTWVLQANINSKINKYIFFHLLNHIFSWTSLPTLAIWIYINIAESTTELVYSH